jgi:hypothetical protein
MYVLQLRRLWDGAGGWGGVSLQLVCLAQQGYFPIRAFFLFVPPLWICPPFSSTREVWKMKGWRVGGEGVITHTGSQAVKRPKCHVIPHIWHRANTPGHLPRLFHYGVLGRLAANSQANQFRPESPYTWHCSEVRTQTGSALYIKLNIYPPAPQTVPLLPYRTPCQLNNAVIDY